MASVMIIDSIVFALQQRMGAVNTTYTGTLSISMHSLTKIFYHGDVVCGVMKAPANSSAPLP